MGRTLALLTSQANKDSDSLIGKTAGYVMRSSNDNANTPDKYDNVWKPIFLKDKKHENFIQLIINAYTLGGSIKKMLFA